LFFGPKPLVAQKAYHAQYSMPSGCDSAAAQATHHFFVTRRKKTSTSRSSHGDNPSGFMRAFATPDAICERLRG
jgi:hypothetical protein